MKNLIALSFFLSTVLNVVNAENYNKPQSSYNQNIPPAHLYSAYQKEQDNQSTQYSNSVRSQINPGGFIQENTVYGINSFKAGANSAIRNGINDAVNDIFR